MATAEQMKRYRKKQKAKLFATDYMDGLLTETPEAFIEAKENEFMAKNNLVVCQFNAEFINEFHEVLTNIESHGGTYLISDMFEAWDVAEEKC